jgi:hypothetical protein
MLQRRAAPAATSPILSRRSAFNRASLGKLFARAIVVVGLSSLVSGHIFRGASLGTQAAALAGHRR